VKDGPPAIAFRARGPAGASFGGVSSRPRERVGEGGPGRWPRCRGDRACRQTDSLVRPGGELGRRPTTSRCKFPLDSRADTRRWGGGHIAGDPRAGMTHTNSVCGTMTGGVASICGHRASGRARIFTCARKQANAKEGQSGCSSSTGPGSIACSGTFVMPEIERFRAFARA